MIVGIDLAATGSTTAIYYCENKEWAGRSGLPGIPLEIGPDAPDPTKQQCGGSPVAVWRAL